MELTVKPLQIVSDQLNGLVESMIALLPNFIAAFVILLITGAFAFIVGRILERLMRRSRARPPLIDAIVKLARIAIWLLGFLTPQRSSPLTSRRQNCSQALALAPSP